MNNIKLSPCIASSCSSMLMNEQLKSRKQKLVRSQKVWQEQAAGGSTYAGCLIVVHTICHSAEHNGELLWKSCCRWHYFIALLHTWGCHIRISGIKEGPGIHSTIGFNGKPMQSIHLPCCLQYFCWFSHMQLLKVVGCDTERNKMTPWGKTSLIYIKVSKAETGKSDGWKSIGWVKKRKEKKSSEWKGNNEVNWKDGLVK